MISGNKTTFLIVDEHQKLPEPKLPSYGAPGRIFFELQNIDRSDSPWLGDRYEIEVIDFDGNSSIYWLNEGMGIEYWLQQWLDLDEPGFYVVEGVSGRYIRGEWGHTDDDEEWDLELVRRADEDEIGAGSLRPSDKTIRRFAHKLAETINGGVWEDPQFYTEEQRRLWRKHAHDLLRYLWVYEAPF